MAKVSVIIPIYNVSDYLGDCLDSLLCQTYRHFEVIGVDDGSTDNSVEIYSAYMRDKRFKLVRNYENQGLPLARNLGILHAEGDYIYFVDSDDWVSVDALEVLLEIALRDEVDIVIGGVAKYYDSDGSLETPDNHGKVMAVERSAVDLHEAPELFHSVTSWNKLVRTNFIKEQGLIFKSPPRRYEDMLTYKWYLSDSKISNISRVTYYYRQRATDRINASIMQDTSINAHTDRILAYADILSFTKQKGLFLTKVDPLHGEQAMMNLPRALSWIIPKVFSAIGDDGQLIQFVCAAQQLTSYFDERYILGLADNIKPAVRILCAESPCDALVQCKELFTR